MYLFIYKLCTRNTVAIHYANEQRYTHWNFRRMKVKKKRRSRIFLQYTIRLFGACWRHSMSRLGADRGCPGLWAPWEGDHADSPSRGPAAHAVKAVICRALTPGSLNRLAYSPWCCSRWQRFCSLPPLGFQWGNPRHRTPASRTCSFHWTRWRGSCGNS